MFSLFWQGMQQDFKIFLLAPLFCAIFRLAFIEVYGSEKLPRKGAYRKWFQCFNYGFWWGLDWNAYAFLLPLGLISIPGAFLPFWHEAGDTLRAVFALIFLLLLYTAFMGKMIFYFHFRDTFNQTLRLGRNADKMNFLDIFFHQNHGAWILLGYLPYGFLCWQLARWVLSLPVLPYWQMESEILQYAANAAAFAGAVVLFYWMRYGGTLRHRNKPEWDTVPKVVKEDIFFGKAVVDDLLALEMVYKSQVSELLTHDDATTAKIWQGYVRQGTKEDFWEQFARSAGGPRLKKPSHIFWLLGESHSQLFFDPPWLRLHLMQGSEDWRREPGTAVINNFLPAGMISQPSLVSQLEGIYDGDLELNENKLFWQHSTPLAMPRQMRSLGYRTEFYYGGGLNWGSMVNFTPACGFDVSFGGPELCAKDAPRTWLGVYDHLFLAGAERKIEELDDGRPAFHYIYTTSNHGPYNMPMEELGYRAEEVLKEVPELLKILSGQEARLMGGVWYTDHALMEFAGRMREKYPDALFIVTGDHAGGLPSPKLASRAGLLTRDYLNLREDRLPSFAMQHPGLRQDMLKSTIGTHLNILPTLMELIAPKGFTYYSLLPTLLEPLDHVVTPYCWLDQARLGDYKSSTAQALAPALELLPTEHDTAPYKEERDALVELTGWLLRHPEFLCKA